jgi:hypothetical protein
MSIHWRHKAATPYVPTSIFSNLLCIVNPSGGKGGIGDQILRYYGMREVTDLSDQT